MGFSHVYPSINVPKDDQYDGIVCWGGNVCCLCHLEVVLCFSPAFIVQHILEQLASHDVMPIITFVLGPLTVPFSEFNASNRPRLEPGVCCCSLKIRVVGGLPLSFDALSCWRIKTTGRKSNGIEAEITGDRYILPRPRRHS